MIEIILIAIGLSMDAFAVSLSRGLSLQKYQLKYSIIAGAYFGIFQGVMPIIGYYAGITFSKVVDSYDHWIVFILLAFIGGKMVYEGIKGEEENKEFVRDENSKNIQRDKEDKRSFLERDKKVFGVKIMLTLAVATSIDALGVGVSFAFLGIAIFSSALIIGISTFIISAFGVKLGSLFGTKYKRPAEITGGLILVGIGIKILVQGLM
ncbi:MAG: manganese efflux pump MntP family protein [Anaerovoracaceae bacterium]